VRGKVEAIESDEPEVPDAERRAAAERARAYFALAHRFATARYPRTLVMMAGLSGSGKSYVAAALAGRIAAAHVSSDAVRASVATGAATDPDLPYGAAGYTDDARARVYDELHRRASKHVALGRSVVLDATYMRRADRIAARRIAEGAGVRFLAVEAVASEDVVRGRMARRGEGTTPSDARWGVYLEQRRRSEPPDEIVEDEIVRVDGDAPLRTSVDAVLERLLATE
jgi:predicted kinase